MTLEMDIVILFVMYKNVSMMEMIVYFTKKHNAVQDVKHQCQIMEFVIKFVSIMTVNLMKMIVLIDVILIVINHFQEMENAILNVILNNVNMTKEIVMDVQKDVLQDVQETENVIMLATQQDVVMMEMTVINYVVQIVI